jgi:hypothetical protein
MTDGVICSTVERNDTPSVLINWLRSRCVPIGVKHLKVLATWRELWVSGKPSSQSPRGVDIPPTTCICFFWLLDFDVWEYVLQGNQEYGHVVALQAYVLHIGCAYGPAVACGGPVHESE